MAWEGSNMLAPLAQASEVHGMAAKRRKTAPVVVTEGAAQSVLRRGAARELSPEEEKVMRMRLGAALPGSERLERKGRGFADTEIELLAHEIAAHLTLRQRRAARKPGPHPAATSSRAKEKIIRALRKKS
jgi:hypothetical protein